MSEEHSPLWDLREYDSPLTSTLRNVWRANHLTLWGSGEYDSFTHPPFRNVWETNHIALWGPRKCDQRSIAMSERQTMSHCEGPGNVINSLTSPSGVSEGQTMPHCEGCKDRGPLTFRVFSNWKQYVSKERLWICKAIMQGKRKSNWI